MREFQINSNEAGQRFDKYLKKLLPEASGSFIYKMLRKKNIVLNGKKADGSEKLNTADVVKLFLADDTFEKFAGTAKSESEFLTLRNLAFSVEPEIVYEDADIIVINKPSGMLSQKAEAADVSANEYILHTLIERGELTEEMMRTFRPSVCNRLDRNTSGLLIAGKTLKGLQEMAEALKNRSVGKYYRCIVKGEVTESAHIKGYLLKDETNNQVKILNERVAEAKPIETEYRPIRSEGGYTELEVHLITGRSHQIRAHLASIGHPILGDHKYGIKSVNQRLEKELQIHSQMLHAYRMVFADGREIVAPCGDEFEKFWKAVYGSRLL